ncbi:DUF2079 domain-containing protein [Microtetraspora niveoalba]|uniref:DUF2079 domain-containing protein n=1 Tax=Microtetraspora niveoalba TaxID=46175 RepID=UPI000A78EF92|nr:DUF2079 domain-containing protein [Microtetraspora niveoalba]
MGSPSASSPRSAASTPPTPLAEGDGSGAARPVRPDTSVPEEDDPGPPGAGDPAAAEDDSGPDGGAGAVTGREAPSRDGGSTSSTSGEDPGSPAPGGDATCGPGSGDRHRRVWSRHRYRVGLITAVAALVYELLGMVRLHTFRATTFDLVIFDQAVRGYAHFSAPVSPAVGMLNGRGMDYLQLSDHFSPILAVLAPLYWLRDGPETLILAQAVLFALAIPFLWLYARRSLGIGAAYLVAVAYALSWPIAEAADFDIHEVAFVPVLTAAMIERFQARRYLVSFLCMFALLLVKEDMGLAVIGFGAYLVVTGRRFDGVCVALIGAAWTGLVRGALIPMLGGDTGDFWAYGHLGRNAGELIVNIATHPLQTLALLVDNEGKVDTLVLLGWPVLFACLFSPLTLIAVPHVLERLLSDRPAWWVPDHQYNAFVVAILLCAGVDGVVRVVRIVRKRWPGIDGRVATVAWAACVAAIALTLVPRFGFGQLLHPDFYRRDARAVAAAEASALVPSGVVVEAANEIGPALTARATVIVWGPEARMAPWVVADVNRPVFPFNSPEAQRARVGELVQQGYQAVYDREGYVVLRRADR